MRCRFTQFGTPKHKVFYCEDLLSTTKYEYVADSNVLMEVRDSYQRYCTVYNVGFGKDLGVHHITTFAQLFAKHDDAPLVIHLNGDIS